MPRGTIGDGLLTVRLLPSDPNLTVDTGSMHDRQVETIPTPHGAKSLRGRGALSSHASHRQAPIRGPDKAVFTTAIMGSHAGAH